MKVALIGGVLVVGFGILTYADPGWSPENLGSPVNTAGNETQVALTHSGRSLYIVTNRTGGFGLNDIWVSQRKHPQAPWGEPFNLGPIINGIGNDSSPGVHPGRSLMSTRPLWWRCREEGSASTDLPDGIPTTIPAGRRQSGWGPNVNIVQSSDPFYFVDPTTGQASTDFAASQSAVGQGISTVQERCGPDGEFLPAVAVAELNTPSRETHPSIHQNGLIMVFSSNRPGGLGGIDLWVSTRPTADAWGLPATWDRPSIQDRTTAPRTPVALPIACSAAIAPAEAGGDDLLLLFSPVMPTIAQVCGGQ